MKKLFILLPLFTALVLALSGCTTFNGDGFDEDAMSDQGATSLANSRLSNSPAVGRATLSASVEDGLGILYGVVPNEMVRQQALQILAGTPGVYEVLDRTRKR
jgi:osmotically-inducible protein OsmY